MWMQLQRKATQGLLTASSADVAARNRGNRGPAPAAAACDALDKERLLKNVATGMAPPLLLAEGSEKRTKGGGGGGGDGGTDGGGGGGGSGGGSGGGADVLGNQSSHQPARTSSSLPVASSAPRYVLAGHSSQVETCIGQSAQFARQNAIQPSDYDAPAHPFNHPPVHKSVFLPNL